MFYFALYAILLVVATFFYVRKGVRFSIFTIYYAFFLLFYGPAFFVYNSNNRLYETDYTITTAQMLSLFVVCFFFGKFLFNKRNPGRTIKKVNYGNWISRKKEEKIAIRSEWVKGILFLVCIIIILGLFVYGGIDSLLSLVRNPLADAETVKDLRAEGGVDGWIAPIYTYTIGGIARLISFVFIGWAFKKNNILLKLIGFAFAGLLGVAYLANLSKSSFIVYYAQLVVFFLVFFNVKINFKKILLISCLVFPVLIMIYIVATSSSGASQALDLIGDRVFNEPNRVLQLYPEYYPGFYPHTYGMNIRVIHDLFTDQPFVPANIAVARGLEKVSFNAMFIADAYVDFSFFGVAIQSIFVGYLLSYLDYLVFSRNNYLKKALFAGMLFGVFTLINSGLIASLFAFGLLTLPVLAYMLEKNRPKRRPVKRFPTANVSLIKTEMTES